MPNWKKIVTSGSNAHLNQITASAFQFIGSGTAELEVQGHITASGNISSSGNINGAFYKIRSQTLASRHSTQGITFGNGSDKANIDGVNIKLNAPVTASGNISASGTIISNDVNVFGDLDIEGNHFADVKDDHFRIGSGKNIKLMTNVTASGNISASGTLTTDDITQLNVKKSELTGSYGTMHGAFNINYGNGDSFSASLASAGDGYGEIFSHLPINGPSAGDLVVHSGGDWRPADADNESTTNAMLGVALADGDNVPGPVLIRGMVRLGAGHIIGASGNNGDPLYLSTTTGHVQIAVPGSGDFARIVGYCIDEDNDIIYFNPSSTFVEVS